MNLLEYLLPARISATSENWWNGGQFGGFWGGRQTRANIRVDENNALTCQAVLSCTRALVEPLSVMPIEFFQTKDDYHREPISGWQEDLLKWPDPEARISGMAFRERTHAHQINWNGGGFAEIVWLNGEGVALNPIHPSRVHPSLDPLYDYQVTNDDGTTKPMHARDVLHIPGMLPEDGIWSRGMVPTILETIGYNLAVDRHGSKYFGSGAQPKGLFTSKMNPKDYDNYVAQWKRIHGSPESSELMMASEGSTYTPFSATNEDNQFLGTASAVRESIALAYQVPVYRVTGKKESAANVEQLAIGFVTESLMPWATRLEGQLNLKLLTRAERRAGKYLEMQFASLLRGNIEARMNAYQKGIMIGVLTINRCRQMEGLNSIGPAGDQNFIAANMTTAERALAGDMGNGGTPGSDANGFPADNPVDRQNENLRSLLKFLAPSKRDLFKDEMRALAQEIPERPAEWTEAARVNLTDALRRLFSKEANDAQHLVSGNKDAAAWVREFYAKHRERRVELLTPACHVLRLAGVSRWGDPADLEAWLTARSSELLLASHERDTKEVFARKLAMWPTERAKEVAEEILACGGKGGTPGPCPASGGKIKAAEAKVAKINAKIADTKKKLESLKADLKAAKMDVKKIKEKVKSASVRPVDQKKIDEASKDAKDAYKDSTGKSHAGIDKAVDKMAKLSYTQLKQAAKDLAGEKVGDALIKSGKTKGGLVREIRTMIKEKKEAGDFNKSPGGK